ncbi:MAG: undecaprenyldiphospho-muramoylpentapeptide beta-N-acetylglucosaminyltransferase [Acidobacteria bacterium SCN 69-37]|nr:MAG: undecaprenyldiphospho-muramoylpentapeptide beta-N-acetylglucosaminyltransferase [Acidobacteria bacterium SCN 69-37]
MGQDARTPSRTPALSLVIAGGGTGGHLYPGIAVARELLRQVPDARVSFAGTARGLEARVVPHEGFDLDLIRSAGLKGKSIAARLRGAALLVPSMFDAWRVLSRRRPSVVVGVGGYSSGPLVLLAALRGVPTMVLEQNAAPGLTNRLLARVVRSAAVSYDSTLAHFRGRGFVSGNPVRAEFFPGADARPRTGTPSRVLVLGGSQGARAINTVLPDAAALVTRDQPATTFVHQTGARDLDAARAAYASAGVPAVVEAFFDPVSAEVHAADLVVCRAGATTLAELAAAARPAVLIPFPAATDDHQRHNAQVLVDAGAAVMIEERHLDAGRLAATIVALLADAGALASMARAMAAFARPDAATRIVHHIRELAA